MMGVCSHSVIHAVYFSVFVALRWPMGHILSRRREEEPKKGSAGSATGPLRLELENVVHTNIYVVQVPTY